MYTGTLILSTNKYEHPEVSNLICPLRPQDSWESFCIHYKLQIQILAIVTCCVLILVEFRSLLFMLARYYVQKQNSTGYLSYISDLPLPG